MSVSHSPARLLRQPVVVALGVIRTELRWHWKHRAQQQCVAAYRECRVQLWHIRQAQRLVELDARELAAMANIVDVVRTNAGCLGKISQFGQIFHGLKLEPAGLTFGVHAQYPEWLTDYHILRPSLGSEFSQCILDRRHPQQRALAWC